MYQLSNIAFKIMYGVITFLLRVCNLHINMQNYNDTLRSGDIFLFNHFIRAETGLPQYILYCADPTIKCYAVAHSSFFKIWWMGWVLRKCGAIPHNHPNLMVLLAEKLSQGYKVVIFPQGKMVKDHEPIDMKTGSAVLALGVDIYKRHIKQNSSSYSEELVKFSHTPTVIVPCNISYYPLRVEPNRLTKLGKRAGLPNTMIEELTVEGNIILRDTDMNLNFGEPITVDSHRIDVSGVTDIASCFEVLKPHRSERFDLRDSYNASIYSNLTINKGHIFSEVLFGFLKIDKTEISKYQLQSAVEIACGDLDVEFIQKDYDKLIEMTIRCGLVEDKEYTYRISARIEKEQPFKFVRMSNPIRVYANELEPMTEAKAIIYKAVKSSRRVSRRGFILLPKPGVEDKGESVLLIHGLFATPDQFRPLAEDLQKLGYSVYVPLIAGHGTSEKDLSMKTREDWYSSIKKNIPEGKFHVMGFSTGGLIATRIADEHDVLSLSITCTPLRLVSKGINFAKILRSVKFPKYWGNNENPDTYKLMPITTLCELIDMIEETKEIFKRTTTRCLITQTSDDPIVDPESSIEILEMIPGDVDLHVIESNQHDITSSKDLILEFIGETNA